MRTHAANPVAEPLGGDLFRIYFSTRDARNRSSIGFIEISIRQPQKILRISKKAVLGPGSPGTFDDSGVSLSCILNVGTKKYLFYVGWNLGVTVPFRNSIGLAVAETPGGPFRKYSPAPILDRAAVDPFSLSYPFVLRENGVYRMWYGSNLSWGAKISDMYHVIKYAESKEGIFFKREGRVAIRLQKPRECAIARPWVLKEKDLYRMWYSVRGMSYRIGYAQSHDGIHWKRMDWKAGLTVSGSGWDSESVCYASLFHHEGKFYMLYNGNGYGRTGFGLAVLGC